MDASIASSSIFFFYGGGLGFYAESMDLATGEEAQHRKTAGKELRTS